MNTLLNEKAQSDQALPSKVCVFDIDDTLVHNQGGDKNQPVATPDAQAAIDMCLEKGFGIAILSASEGYRKPVIDLFKFENKDVKYDMGMCNYVAGMYTNADTQPGEAPVNPIYISGKTGTWTLKGQGLDRIMRSYFGVSTGGSYVDETNPYLKKYREQHGAKSLPDDVKLSGCMVLFDDNLGKPEDKALLAEVKAFNDIYGTHFQYVKLNPVDGVTVKDVEAGFDKLKISCPDAE
jgi:hypothetical protein